MNPWCDVLNIAIPSLERVHGHREANTYALLLVALLERGGPMTLDEVATRFEEAGWRLREPVGGENPIRPTASSRTTWPS